MRGIIGAAIAGLALAAQPALGMSLQEAVRITVESNPEISEAIFNRQAIGFELLQGKGLLLPQVDLEARSGAERRDTPASRAGLKDDAFAPIEGRVVLRQRIFDGFEAASEIQRQAARLDGASFRVWERSEFLALQASRAYIDIVRLHELERLARANIAFHERFLRDVRSGADGGAISVADVQQVEERIFAATVRLQQVRDDKAQAESLFIQLVGMPLEKPGSVPALATRVPADLDQVLLVARTSNPLLSLRTADLDAAHAEIRLAESRFYPKVNLELSGRTGEDLDGEPGRTTDARAEVVMRWNVFSGGVNRANRAEQVERASEARMRLHTAQREVEQEARASWERRTWLREQMGTLSRQLGVGRRLLDSYREQFRVGERSLLDVLDTQNALFNIQVALTTAQYAEKFTDYRLLASMGKLLDAFDVRPPPSSRAAARVKNHVPPTPPSEDMWRGLRKFDE